MGTTIMNEQNNRHAVGALIYYALVPIVNGDKGVIN